MKLLIHKPLSLFTKTRIRGLDAFIDELADPLPGAPAVGVYRQACSGIPLAVRFVGRDRLLWNSMVQGIQRFRQVRTASCVIPYVLCGVLYYKCRCVSRGSLPALIYLGGQCYMESPS